MGIIEKFYLKDKVAIVTGGAGLYGKYITEAIAEAEAYVYVCSRNIENCKKIADKLTKKGYSVFPEKLDLADEKSMDLLIEKILNKSGRIDILVNNAVLRAVKDYYDRIENFRLSMEVNFVGVFEFTRKVIEIMKKNKSGSIINISSIQGVVGPDFTLYLGTNIKPLPDYFFHKAGLINLTKYFASKFGEFGIRVNCVSPGGLYSGQDKKFVERYKKKTFLGRMAKGEDIKGVIVFLASDASSYITGANILVDGGYTAK